MLNEPFGFGDNVEFQQEQNSILNDAKPTEKFWMKLLPAFD